MTQGEDDPGDFGRRLTGRREQLGLDTTASVVLGAGVGHPPGSTATGPVAHFAVVESAADGPGLVGFEVDRIDDAQREGWSVLDRGPMLRVVDRTELALTDQAGVEPWRPGALDVVLRLVVRELSGRRLRMR